jgi:hypothetical protein
MGFGVGVKPLRLCKLSDHTVAAHGAVSCLLLAAHIQLRVLLLLLLLLLSAASGWHFFSTCSLARQQLLLSCHVIMSLTCLSMLAHKQLSFWQSAAFYGIPIVHVPVSVTASGGNLMRHVTIYIYLYGWQCTHNYCTTDSSLGHSSSCNHILFNKTAQAAA